MTRMNQMRIENERWNNRKSNGPPKPWASKERAKYSESNIPELWQHWYDEYEDLLQGVPEWMPLFCSVNHEIPLINRDQQYHYHLPHCQNLLKGEFNEKVGKYTWAGWWKLTTASQAAPMLCLSKKDHHLCTVIDCRQRNENTVKDVIPMLDQDRI